MHPDWPSLGERRKMITDFCRGRMVAVPVLKKPAKSYDAMKFFIVRYRKHKERLLFADDLEEYLEVEEHILNKYGKPNSGMYASNAVYHHRHPTLPELNQTDNVHDYLGMIDIDHVLGNEQVALPVLHDILAMLPDEGVWCLVSGSGVHIKINGFKSWQHAQSFIESRGIKAGVVEEGSKVKVDLLNDVSRIGTVPFEVYKKDEGVLCFPFMPEELDEVFDRPDWRAYYRSREPMPWHLPPADEVLAWNENRFDELPRLERSVKYKAKALPPAMRTELNEETLRLYADRFDSCIPPCIRRGMYSELLDGRHRVIAFLTSFMLKVGFSNDFIMEKCTERNASFATPLPTGDLERIVSDVINTNLDPPGCRKVRSRGGEKAYPYLNLGSLNLCPYEEHESCSCVAKSAWKMFILNISRDSEA